MVSSVVSDTDWDDQAGVYRSRMFEHVILSNNSKKRVFHSTILLFHLVRCGITLYNIELDMWQVESKHKTSYSAKIESMGEGNKLHNTQFKIKSEISQSEPAFFRRMCVSYIVQIDLTAFIGKFNGSAATAAARFNRIAKCTSHVFTHP